jgi:hypothetical protein
MKAFATWMASWALAAVIATPAAAATKAPARGALDQIVDANREAVALYQRGQLAEARRTLKAALELCGAAGLDKHPVAARTHVHLGIVLAGGLGLGEAGAREFREALAIDPSIELTPGLATPEARAVFEAVVLAPPRGVGPAKATPPSRTEASPPTDDGAAPTLARRAPRRPADDETGEESADVEDAEPDRGSWSSRLELRVLTGAGGGWSSGTGELNADFHTSGAFSGSLLNHATIAVGAWLGPTFLLSLEGRLQRVAGPNVVAADGRTYHPATGAVAVFATATWSPRLGAVRPFVSASVGAGRIREVVTFSRLRDCGPSHAETCVDTVGGGPLLAGAAAGLTFGLSKSVALVASLGAQLAAPERTFNLDLNAGVALRP